MNIGGTITTLVS